MRIAGGEQEEGAPGGATMAVPARTTMETGNPGDTKNIFYQIYNMKWLA